MTGPLRANQNDVASTNPNEGVSHSLQELAANRYHPVDASQNVVVSNFLGALCWNPHKRCCWQILYNECLKYYLLADFANDWLLNAKR
ncbi:hypothetical protein F511_12968 [Dorcoceras hygrometricum]|uniref:Uncharacterized protein n=1 Tax=Dorcoceras hygrometricum TaxID=472368 RepID=A0A2Z7BGB7_9LAMI|nr:hypothetical protein F511_12968 [Dorcoceras hygrometricum]